MLSRYLRCAIVLLSALLVGCQSTSDGPLSNQVTWQQMPSYPSDVFSAREITAPEALFVLNAQQQAEFLAYFDDVAHADIPGHSKLFSYLNAHTDEFTFKGRTYTATQAYDKQQGNCLSLAMLTTALARLVDIDVEYQQVNSAPIYHKYDNIMTISSHVRTKIFDPTFNPASNTIVIRRPSVIVDYFPTTGDISGGKVADDDFIAMYYQNMAGEAIIEGDLDLAYANISQSLQVSPDNPESLNTLAVLLSKKGETDAAEAIYQYALDTGKGSVNTISNYASLKEKRGDIKGATALLETIETIRDDNPYQWLDVADTQLQKRHYAIARKYYRKAITVAPYLAQSYLGLAKSYYLQGEPQRALGYMQKAKELVYVPAEEQLYQAKLLSLKIEILQ